MTVKLCQGRCTCCDEIDSEFVDGTTCHGLSRFCNNWSLPRRVFWFLLVVASVSLLTTQLYDRTQAFLRFEMKTEIKISVAETLALPTITICNVNLFSRGLLTEMDYALLENITKSLVIEMDKLGLPDGDNDEDMEKWKTKFLNNVQAFETKEKNILALYNETNFTVDNWVKRTGWQLDTKNHKSREHSAILGCSVGKQHCSFENFTVVNSREGLCYSFNYQAKNPWIQKIPGTYSGLGIVVDIDEDDYTGYTLDGQEMFGSGLKVILHDWYERPDPTLAVGVPTGTISYVTTRKKVRTTEDKPPWGRCYSRTESGLPYSRRNCLLACQTNFTLNWCDCRLWYEEGAKGEQCGVAQSTACLWLKSAMEDDIEDECIRSCLEACEETTYQYGISYTKLVSAHTVDDLKTYLQILIEDANHHNHDNFDEHKHEEFNASFVSPAFIEQNIVILEVGYSEMAVETTSSTPATPISAFLGDIGGQFGLFAGISIITICELFEYSIVKFAAVLQGKTSRRKSRGQKNKMVSPSPFDDDFSQEQPMTEKPMV